MASDLTIELSNRSKSVKISRDHPTEIIGERVRCQYHHRRQQYLLWLARSQICQRRFHRFGHPGWADLSDYQPPSNRG